MINAVGLQNPGVEKVISEELPALAEIFHKPVMANVSGFSVSDYAKTVEKLEANEGEEVTLDKVLVLGGESLKVGAPYVEGAYRRTHNVFSVFRIACVSAYNKAARLSFFIKEHCADHNFQPSIASIVSLV